MMKKIVYLFTALIALGLVNCGGEVVGPTAASGSATAADAALVKTGFDSLVTNLSATSLQSPTNLAPVGGVTSAAVKLSNTDPFAACTTISPTTVVDADGDGIAASKTYTFNCNNISYPGHPNQNRLGNIVITDDDTTSVADGGAYSYEYDLSYSSPDYESEWMGFFNLTRPQGNLLFTSQFRSSFSERGEGGLWESNYRYELMPTDSANPWNGGSSEIEGFYRLAYSGTVNNQDVDYDFTWEIEGAMEFESTGTSGCTQFYKNGYFQFTDGGGNVIRYDYTCTGVTYSFNGTVISP